MCIISHRQARAAPIATYKPEVSHLRTLPTPPLASFRKNPSSARTGSLSSKPFELKPLAMANRLAASRRVKLQVKRAMRRSAWFALTYCVILRILRILSILRQNKPPMAHWAVVHENGAAHISGSSRASKTHFEFLFGESKQIVPSHRVHTSKHLRTFKKSKHSAVALRSRFVLSRHAQGEYCLAFKMKRKFKGDVVVALTSDVDRFWCDARTSTLPSLPVCSRLLYVHTGTIDGWLFFAGLEKLVDRSILEIKLTSLYGDALFTAGMQPSYVETPRLLAARCPLQLASVAQIDPIILDKECPGIVKVEAVARPPNYFNNSRLIESRMGVFRPINPMFHGDKMLVRYTDAHECVSSLQPKPGRSSFIVETSSMFDTWSLNTELNVPMLSAKCYRGLEDPRNFNKTHFLAAVQVGDDCVTRQALVTKGAIVLLNGPTDSKRSEKNWVKFSDGVLVYQLFDESLKTTLLRCSHACTPAAYFKWEFWGNSSHFPLHELRSGSNWLIDPEDKNIRFSIIHRHTKDSTYSKNIYKYYSHYIWWDTSTNLMRISGPVWHTTPLNQYFPDEKGLVEFVSSIKFSSSSMIRVAFGSGDCHAVVASVNIVTLKQYFEKNNYFVARLRGEKLKTDENNEQNDFKGAVTVLPFHR